MQLCLNFSLSTGTWVTEALCRSRASSWNQTPLLEPSTRRWCPTPNRWTCPKLLPQQQSGYERFCLHGDKEGVLQLLLDKSGNNTGTFYDKCHRHRAAEKAVSTMRGLARTYVAVLKDKIPSSEVTTHSPMLPWTIRHAAWVLWIAVPHQALRQPHGVVAASCVESHSRLIPSHVAEETTLKVHRKTSK